MVKQLNLFQENKAEFSDSAFYLNKTSPVHRWVPWIAGFSSDFVVSALEKFVPENGVILDPFAGIGTTLVEAILRGCDVVGFEINPYAAMVTRVKASLLSVDEVHLKDMISDFKKSYNPQKTPNSKIPEGFKTRSEFYSPKVLNKVLLVQDFIADIKDTTIKDIFRIAFASTMVSYSNYSYEPSLGRRRSSGKADIEDYPVHETISSKLMDFLDDISWFKSVAPTTNSKIITDSFFNYEKYLQPDSIDCLITSPPYLNNYHYVRNTRPQLYWLGFGVKPNDLKYLETNNFGTYWQTVRDTKKVELTFSLTELEENLEVLSSIKKDKGIYGGNGWANYAASYFNDCYRFAEGIKYLLKPGKSAVVVLGNSILQGVHIPTDKYFGDIAKLVGLNLENIYTTRKTRIGNSTVQSRGNGTKPRLYESVVEIKKV